MTQIRPESPYGVSKFTAERYLHAYSKLEGLNYTSLRYSNVFGPRQNPHGEAGVVAIFAQKIIDGEKCIIFGDGTKTRDYIYIDDVVDANIKALEKGDNDVFLIGTGEQVKDIEMYNAVKESLGSMEEPEFGEFRKGDIVHMQFDCSKAQKELEWKPKVSFREGVTKTIEWFTRKEV
jgi:UDP-glucose 4-epimerase